VIGWNSLAAVADPSAFAQLLGVLIALIVGTKLLGALAQRFGQPAVLGELVAGVILGGSVLGILDPRDPVISALAEIGVIVLLFQIGLHTSLGTLIKVGGSATAVALVGVAVPFTLGYFGMRALGVELVPALVAGAALTATSVGISARVLSDLGRLDSIEGQVVLGAAVLDDIVGLIILSIIAGIVGGVEVTAFGVIGKTAIAIGFVIVSLLLGMVVIPVLFRMVAGLRQPGTLGLFALAFAFALAWVAQSVGSALIIGAFTAGLILHPTSVREEIEERVTTIGHFFVPIFFASIGAAVELRALADSRSLLIGGVLVVVGVLGKVVAGWAPWGFKGQRLLVGVAMVPRGEVGLIFAQMGLSSGAIGADLFGAIMLMVLVTTFVTPPLLSRIAGQGANVASTDRPGEGGIDDLVSGTMVRKAGEPERVEIPGPEAATGLTASEQAAAEARARIEARLWASAKERDAQRKPEE
jgi:Kef-type K+ transport system membrane component KefB